MNPPFGIKERRCTKKDYLFCCNLIRKTLFPYVSKSVKSSKKQFDDDFKKRYSQIKILMKGKRRIGLYQLAKDESEKNTAYLTKIFLSPAYQRKGIGSFLMKYFETLGFRKIKMQVWENNPAVRFYRKLGYKIIAKKDHKYLMEKVIQH